MWQARYEKVFPGLSKQAVWAVWSDVKNWPQWDEDLESTTITEPFDIGTKFKLRPKGGPNVSIEITAANPSAGFTDVTFFPLARMYDIHEMEDTPSGLKLKSTIRVEGTLGWLWRRIVAQNVAAGVPKQMDALARFALANSKGDSVGGTQK